jgi:hypothetical protein
MILTPKDVKIKFDRAETDISNLLIIFNIIKESRSINLKYEDLTILHKELQSINNCLNRIDRVLNKDSYSSLGK